MKRIFFLFLLSAAAAAQQAVLPLPRDARNNPLMAGLGEPQLYELTITNTTYGTGNRITLPSTGDSTNRVYRHFWVYNADASRTAYFCFGAAAAACSTSIIKVRPGMGFVDDFSYFGLASSQGTGYIYYKLDSSGTASVDVRVW